MSQRELFEQAMKRPRNYHNLSAQDHWRIDRELGVLDWDGSCLHSDGKSCSKCEKKYWETHDRNKGDDEDEET